MPRNRRNRCGRLGARAIDSSNPASGSSAGNLNPWLLASIDQLAILRLDKIIVISRCFVHHSQIVLYFPIISLLLE